MKNAAAATPPRTRAIAALELVRSKKLSPAAIGAAGFGSVEEVIELVASHVNEGGQALAVAILNVFGFAGQPVGCNPGRFLGRAGFNAWEVEPHLSVDMHVVNGHGTLPTLLLFRHGR